MISTLLTCSLVCNTYYPLSISTSSNFRGSLIHYANCIWINNNCKQTIENEYPTLCDYNHITINEVNVNPDLLLRNVAKNMVGDVIYNNRHHVSVCTKDENNYEIITTPLTHNRSKVFIFSNDERKNDQKLINNYQCLI